MIVSCSHSFLEPDLDKTVFKKWNKTNNNMKNAGIKHWLFWLSNSLKHQFSSSLNCFLALQLMLVLSRSALSTSCSLAGAVHWHYDASSSSSVVAVPQLLEWWAERPIRTETLPSQKARLFSDQLIWPFMTHWRRQKGLRGIKNWKEQVVYGEYTVRGKESTHTYTNTHHTGILYLPCLIWTIALSVYVSCGLFWSTGG